ncbi:efflux RND transporter periplasmic adaptor subunit [Mesobacillus harenae]|uniref:efflux RND transporter periplasmic adaptor subunit n=1 Tax=Mesobacillus harenae TaxID=2213203 RepID=UPI0015802565|nr:efflux RND transporter periplasmic adaptor subunit [Mesobacillus harenae]
MKKIFLTAAVILIAGNLYLIFKTNSPVERSSYIKDWTEVTRGNITKTLNASGVVAPLEEQFVYYDENTADFKKFLVKKGEKLIPGTPLFEYESNELDAQRAELEQENDQLTRELALVDDQLNQLTYLQTVAASQQSTSMPVTGDGYATEPNSSEPDLMLASIEKEINDIERKQSRILSEIDQNGEELLALGDEGPLQVTSETKGRVKEISHELENPILTIISEAVRVEGIFTETDLKRVVEGMPVYISADILKKRAKGTLGKIYSFPEEDASVDRESRYPFIVRLDDEELDIIKGTHVSVSVVTDEVLDVVTLGERSVEIDGNASQAYVLTSAGTIEQRELSTGLYHNGTYQVKKGIKTGEMIITDPARIKQNQAAFITPLKTADLQQSTFASQTKKNLLRYVGIAFLK